MELYSLLTFDVCKIYTQGNLLDSKMHSNYFKF